MRTIHNEMIPMRDGVRLATDIYLPDREGAYPVILLRTPYNKLGIVKEPLYEHFPRFIANGYGIAVQDCRGTLASEGKMNLNGGNEHEDGYDTVEYLAVQSFCDGNVGMFGLSYFGFTQIAAASGAPEHLKAICPFMCCSLASFGTSPMQTIASFHLGWAYGQILEHPEEYIPDPVERERLLPVLKENMGRLGQYSTYLPMNENPAAHVEGVPMLADYVDLTEGVEMKSFWDSIHSPMDYDHMHTAMLHGTGWMDAACMSTIDNFMAARRSKDDLTRESARLLIGPWTHGGVLPYHIEDLDFGAENSGDAQDVTGIMMRWFDRWLKEKDTDVFPSRVHYFVQNSNDWHEASDWPPPESVRTPFYLTSEGCLTEDVPAQGCLEMEYDPENPPPSNLADAKGRHMTADWSELPARSDILRFTSSILEDGATIAGNIRVVLYASTDVPDTDFACRLTDIAPDGYERQITAGLVRARHRNGLFTEDFLTPGETVRYEFGIGHAGYYLAPGHRIGIHVMGALFPQINRNLNTKEAPSLGKIWAVAHDTIYTGGEQASYIDLPLL